MRGCRPAYIPEFRAKHRHRFDPNVIIRAHRFRAEMAGYPLVRGHFMDGESDRADRWYLVPSDAASRIALMKGRLRPYSFAHGAPESGPV